jgi:hypothetical protein
MPADAVPGSTIPEDSEAEILLHDGTWVWAQVIGQRKDRRGHWCVGLRWYASPTVGGREGWYLYNPRLIRRPPLTPAARLRRRPAQIPAVPRRPVVVSTAVPGCVVSSRPETSRPGPGLLVRGHPEAGWAEAGWAVTRTVVAAGPVTAYAVVGPAQGGQARKLASRGVPGLLLEQMPGPEFLDQPVKDRPHRATLPPSQHEIQATTDLGEPG